jgi:CHAD domain-containing protein
VALQIRRALAAAVFSDPNCFRRLALQPLRAVVSMTREPYWDTEKLAEAAATELLKHGGNKRDLDLLWEHFRKIAEPETRSQTEIPE